MGRCDSSPGAVTKQLSWLLPCPLLADNPLLFEGLARQGGCHPKAALEVFLCKDKVVRELYRSELVWLVYVTQSRALGRRCRLPELQVSK